MALLDHDPIVDLCVDDCEHTDCQRELDLDADLGGHLADVLDTSPDDADLLVADRMMRAVIYRRRRVAEAEAVAAAALAEVQAQNAAYLDTVRRRFSTDWLENWLAQYHQARLAADERAKTIELPCGQLKARRTPDRFVVLDGDDREVFLSWAVDERPDLVRVKHEPNLPELKRLARVVGENVVLADGEIVPGVQHVPGEVRYTAVERTVEASS